MGGVYQDWGMLAQHQDHSAQGSSVRHSYDSEIINGTNFIKSTIGNIDEIQNSYALWQSNLTSSNLSVIYLLICEVLYFQVYLAHCNTLKLETN